MQSRIEDTVSVLSSPCLDLSRKYISDLPEEITGCEHLECLYLEGNRLTSLSASLFSSCPNLHWLDLRNNLLTHLPPSIHILRRLKTLLLQGNRLTSLPPELGELRHLSGLSLASNPLSSPPPSVVQKGTSAVLHYLREQLARRKEAEKGGERGNREERREDEEEGSFESGDESNVTALRPNRRDTLMPNVDPRERNAQVTPLVLQPHLQQAHIHPHCSPSSPSPSHYVTHAKSGEKREQKTRKGRERRVKREGNELQHQQHKGSKYVHVPPLTDEERLQANKVIEKQRSKERLEQWRADAREAHLRSTVKELDLPLEVTDTTPFATDRQQTSKVHIQNEEKSAEKHNPDSTLRSNHEEVVRAKVEQYNKTLQGQRRQVGLIAAPSSELLEAEMKLAEALALWDHMEDRKTREYRLTAFIPHTNL